MKPKTLFRLWMTFVVIGLLVWIGICLSWRILPPPAFTEMEQTIITYLAFTGSLVILWIVGTVLVVGYLYTSELTKILEKEGK